MRDIPPEIYHRLEFSKSKLDHPDYRRIKNIIPTEPCECGQPLMHTRSTRIQRCTEPVRHWREYCSTCGLCSVFGENTWLPTRELTAKLRAISNNEDK